MTAAFFTSSGGVAIFISALAAVLTSFCTLVVTIRNAKQTQAVHVLVNQRMTDMQARVAELVGKLEESDTEVPPDRKGTDAR